MARHEQSKRPTKSDEAIHKIHSISPSKPSLTAQAPVVSLQRFIGNQAVQRLIQREEVVELPEDTIYGTPPRPEGNVTLGEPTFDFGAPSSGHEDPTVDMDASDGSITLPPEHIHIPQEDKTPSSGGTVTLGEPTFDYGAPSSGHEDPTVDMDASDGSITLPPEYIN